MAPHVGRKRRKTSTGAAQEASVIDILRANNVAPVPPSPPSPDQRLEDALREETLAAEIHSYLDNADVARLQENSQSTCIASQFEDSAAGIREVNASSGRVSSETCQAQDGDHVQCGAEKVIKEAGSNLCETALSSVTPAVPEERQIQGVVFAEDAQSDMNVTNVPESVSETKTTISEFTTADETHIRSPKDKPRTSEITDSGSWFPGSPLDLDDPKQPLKWHLIAKVLARLPADSMRKLHKTLGNLTELGVAGGSCGIPIGTVCSGSECPMFVLNDLMMLFQGCKFHHCFSCENVAEKRRWITTMFPVEKVFRVSQPFGQKKRP